MDVFALAKILGNEEVAKKAQTFVVSMFGETDQAPHTYATGTGDSEKCDSSVPQTATAADVQFWSILSDVDDHKQRKFESIKWALSFYH